MTTVLAWRVAWLPWNAYTEHREDYLEERRADARAETLIEQDERTKTVVYRIDLEEAG
jgi:hypothetical protein